MDKIQRSRPPKAKGFFSLHPVLKGFSLVFLALMLIAFGYFAADSDSSVSIAILILEGDLDAV